MKRSKRSRKPSKFDDKLISYWIKHYVVKGHCSLCGNNGVIDTTGITTPAGVRVGKKSYCICPNGLAWRDAAEQHPLLNLIGLHAVTKKEQNEQT
jgi:hypothetical protein